MATATDDTRALTTFSIANDVSKYFAIIPAMFQHYTWRWAQIADLCCAEYHAIINTGVGDFVSSVFNALIIVALIPLH